MMLADLDKVVGTCVGKQIHPLLWIPGTCGEILDKVIIYYIRSIFLEMIAVYVGFVGGTPIQPPPVPGTLSVNSFLIIL